MSNKFHDVMIRRSDLLHRSAIWQEVIDHLMKFLDTDAVPAVVGIRTEGGGMVVPQDRIDLALSEIRSGYMAEINEELDKINKSEVSEDGKQKKQAAKKKKAKSGTNGAGPKKDKRKIGARK